MHCKELKLELVCVHKLQESEMTTARDLETAYF